MTAKADTSAEVVEKATVEATPSKLQMAVAGAHRSETDVARDGFRHPAETLEFFGVKANMTLVEIWPGGGWYTEILAPYIASGGGTFYAAGFDTSQGEYYAKGMKKFTDKFTTNADLYGTINVTSLPGAAGIAPAGSADVVLSFRNVHNWMGSGFADEAFTEFFTALRPGGILGIVEHRMPETMDQNEKAKSGYVREDVVIAMAQKAGFVLIGSSEINANPNDTADHPRGVWTLPPRLATPKEGSDGAKEFDQAKYIAIGESDRMTLKFQKPLQIEDAVYE